jgi:hypothetical protein
MMIAPEDPRMREWTLLEKVANSLIYQYLIAKELRHTVSVFLPEVGPRNADLSDEMIMTLLSMKKIPSWNMVHPQPNNDEEPSKNKTNSMMTFLKVLEHQATRTTHEMQTQTVDEDHRLILGIYVSLYPQYTRNSD